MAYTAYKFKPSFVEKRLKSYKSNLMKFKGHDNLVANAVRVIRERLEADPRRYLGCVRISVSGEVIPGAAQRGCPLYLRCSMPDLMR